MCGFSGFFSKSNFNSLDAYSIGKLMSDVISHRGPDDSGVWVDDISGIMLTHRRLSILDLSTAGHQPMVSSSGRYVIAFNGEIYNHLEIRHSLQVECQSHSQKGVGNSAIQWRGHSDTETLLMAIELWGLEKAIKYFVGMFAFALFDRVDNTLSLVRDRLGEKPLYYGWQGSSSEKAFIFGSELKSLKMHPLFERNIDRNSIVLQMKYSYIPAPWSIYKNIFKLKPGHILQISLSKEKNANDMATPKIWPYWSLDSLAKERENGKFKVDEIDAKLTLEKMLLDAVRQQMVADVPTGAFLSGGVDSSLIVSLMQAQSSRPIKTFTIGFNENEFNEAHYASQVAKHLGTDHTELYVDSAQALKTIPLLSQIYDEPFSDSSQIPTLLVSQLAHQQVKVSLSGDGADEFFGGYSRYARAEKLIKIKKKLPYLVSTWLNKLIHQIPPSGWNNLASPFLSLGTISTGMKFGDKIYKLSDLLTSKDEVAFYEHFVKHWTNVNELVLNSNENQNYFTEPREKLVTNLDIYEKLMLADQNTYLPDDILVKLDRASMATSLENRAPFLDHRVIEYSWQLPLNLKYRNNETKWILREILYKYTPKSLIDRPKMGFGVPIGIWLRTTLRDWAEDLLDESRLIQEGFFNPALVREKWTEHLSGKRNWQYLLWDVLMFQAWLENEK